MTIEANTVSKIDRMNTLAGLLENYGAKIEIEEKVLGAYRVTFNFENSVVTLRILLEDYSKADIVITNITTLPEKTTGNGFGTRAVQLILQWANDNELKAILATQIRTGNEEFWIKNGFVKVEGDNPTNDFKYVG